MGKLKDYYNNTHDLNNKERDALLNEIILHITKMPFTRDDDVFEIWYNKLLNLSTSSVDFYRILKMAVQASNVQYVRKCLYEIYANLEKSESIKIVVDGEEFDGEFLTRILTFLTEEDMDEQDNS